MDLPSELRGCALLQQEVFCLPDLVSGRSGSRSRSTGQQPILCYHHDIAPLRTIKVQGPTFGKRFYGCVHWPKACGFFKSAYEEDKVQELQFQVFERDTRVADPELRNGELEDEVKKLREFNRKLEDEVAELAFENTEQLNAIASTRDVKNVYNVLVASWIFFSMCVCAFAVLLLLRGG